MNILVLGSSGQIGSDLVSRLEYAGHRVLTYDIVENSYHDLRYIDGHLYRFLGQADFCFFLAFDVGGSPYLDKYQHKFDFIHNNTLIMSNTFQKLKDYKIPFVFASSQMSNMNHSPYGVLKRVGEFYTDSLDRGIVAKFWNVYGFEKDMDKAHVITDFIRMGFEDSVITMRTDGSETRQFLHVSDCSAALEAIMCRYNIGIDFPKGHFNITSGRDDTIIQVAHIVQKCFSLAGHQIGIKKGIQYDGVQLNAQNKHYNSVTTPYLNKWWAPKLGLYWGIEQVFDQIGSTYYPNHPAATGD